MPNPESAAAANNNPCNWTLFIWIATLEAAGLLAFLVADLATSFAVNQMSPSDALIRSIIDLFTVVQEVILGVVLGLAMLFGVGGLLLFIAACLLALWKSTLPLRQALAQFFRQSSRASVRISLSAVGSIAQVFILAIMAMGFLIINAARIPTATVQALRAKERNQQQSPTKLDNSRLDEQEDDTTQNTIKHDSTNINSTFDDVSAAGSE